VQRVCRVLGVPRSTHYHHRRRDAIPAGQRPTPKKRGPQGPCDDEALVRHIRGLLAESPFHGEGYRKMWARLRHQNIRTSAERVRRLMRQHGLQAPHRVGNPHGPKAHDGTIITERPDVMWGTDLTTTVTAAEGNACVFVAVDHCTGECVGLHAAKRGTRFEALEPLRQGVREYFGSFGPGVAAGLSIRHDHGSAYLSGEFQRELAYLGMTSSPSYVREPEGNGCAERFIRTLKENLLWVRPFATVAELAAALGAFKRQYNEHWLIGRHGHRTPGQVRQEFRDGVRDVA
jgi:putative transposase